jgi:RNA polymerase sigma factor (sigma-70 family)
MTRQEKNAELIARYRAGDKEALGKLVQANEGLILKVTQSTAAQHGMTPAHHDYDDLLQEGRMGLMHAASKYDSSKWMFTTYAVPWIQQRVRRHCVAKRGTIHVPEAFVNPKLKAKAAKLRMFCASGEDPDKVSPLTLIESPPQHQEIDDRDEKEWVLRTIRSMAPGYRKALLAAFGEPVKDERHRKAIATSRKAGLKVIRRRLGVSA